MDGTRKRITLSEGTQIQEEKQLIFFLICSSSDASYTTWSTDKNQESIKGLQRRCKGTLKKDSGAIMTSDRNNGGL